MDVITDEDGGKSEQGGSRARPHPNGVDFAQGEAKDVYKEQLLLSALHLA
jgi:hypothetical protein